MIFGYVGVIIVGISYLLPVYRMLLLQAVASVLLAVYSYQLHSWSFSWAAGVLPSFRWNKAVEEPSKPV
jgi:hypothetical protein